MAKNYDYLDPRHYWSQRDPRRCSKVWIDNTVYSRLKKDLSYYRQHPGKADPTKLLELIDQIVNAWDGERRSFTQAQKELISQYNSLVDAVNSKTDEIRRLNDVILRLDRQLQEQEREQRRLQNQINEIIAEKNRNSSLATQYLNEAIEAYNGIVNDPAYQKFVPDQVEALKFIFQTVNELELDSAAIQGLAVDALGKLFAMNKEVMRKRIEFDLIYDVVYAEAKDLRKQYDEWQTSVYFDPPENMHKADMAFWSYNWFPQLRDSVDRLYHDMESAPGDQSVHVKELHEIQHQLAELRKAGILATNDVIMRSQQSEKVEALGNIASLILVEDFLFKVVYMGFNNNDERSSYVTQLKNPAAGMSMQFVFTPLSPTQIGCNYEVSFDGYQDEMRVNSILASIWQELRPNQITPLDGHGDNESHIVDHIEFVKPGQSARLADPSPISKQ